MNKIMNNLPNNNTPDTPTLTPDTPEKRQIRMAGIYKDERLIPVTYRCWGCQGEVTILEPTDVPMASKIIDNICPACRGIKVGMNEGRKVGRKDRVGGRLGNTDIAPRPINNNTREVR